MANTVDAFVPFPKMPRLRRGVVITEKIDGTNAQVVIAADGFDGSGMGSNVIATHLDEVGRLLTMRVGSRTRWITPGKSTDNYGFAGWCQDNASELFQLGTGQHFGEWYGKGIQRGYGLDERRFALFNVHRWNAENPPPSCCEIVPVLFRGDLSAVGRVLFELGVDGSHAVPGFKSPEGLVVWHDAARQYFKVLIENDHLPKGLCA